MTDIHNVQAFALYMQKTDIKFDLYSVTKEMEKQVSNTHKLWNHSCDRLYLKYNHQNLENNHLRFFHFKIGYEFDFMREADAMEKIRRFLYENNKRSPVLVPRLIRDMVTRYVMLHPIFFPYQ